MKKSSKNSLAASSMHGTYEDISYQNNYGSSYLGGSYSMGNDLYKFNKNVQEIKSTKSYLDEITKKYQNSSPKNSKSKCETDGLNFPIGKKVPVDNKDEMDIRYTIKGTKDNVPNAFKRLSQRPQQQQQQEIQIDEFRKTPSPETKYRFLQNNQNSKTLDYSVSNIEDHNQYQGRQRAEMPEKLDNMPIFNQNNYKESIQPKTKESINEKLIQMHNNLLREYQMSKNNEGFAQSKLLKERIQHVITLCQNVIKSEHAQLLSRYIKESEIRMLDVVNELSQKEAQYINKFLSKIQELAKEKLVVAKKDDVSGPVSNPTREEFIKRASEFIQQMPNKDPLKTPLALALYEEAIKLNLREDEWNEFLQLKLDDIQQDNLHNIN